MALERTSSSTYALLTLRKALPSADDATTISFKVVNRSPYLQQPSVQLLPWERWWTQPGDILAVHARNKNHIYMHTESCPQGQEVCAKGYVYGEVSLGETGWCEKDATSKNLMVQVDLHVGSQGKLSIFHCTKLDLKLHKGFGYWTIQI